MANDVIFPVKLSLRLDWSEMDMFGHINNVMYFKFIQASRVNYWENVKLMRDYKEQKIGPMLLSTSCHFKKPLFYPGNITLQARVEFIKNSSMGLHHQIINDKQELAAEARDIIVLYNFAENQTVVIPDDLRKNIEEIEGKKI
ncbi:MAG TPA: acyl-CoA thioesterase [Bacteroidia bacterium]|jgi:acyl-CoA thioester hydrolase|nr:acyl-CoA thioesterase [Bacteroidia bacterium]